METGRHLSAFSPQEIDFKDTQLRLVREQTANCIKDLNALRTEVMLLKSDQKSDRLNSSALANSLEGKQLEVQEHFEREKRERAAVLQQISRKVHDLELEQCGPAASYDPFEPVKFEALGQAEESLQASLAPLIEFVANASVEEALDAALLRSLWGNQADLSLSAGEVSSVKGGQLENLVSDRRGVAVELLKDAKDVILVLDNHGLEVLCDLVLVDAILRLNAGATVTLHVKDAPVFVSDVTDKDVPEVLSWLQPRLPELAQRLTQNQAEGRLKVKSHDFYTGGRAFWELPKDLQEDYAEAVVVLKGDANYRRLLGDLHWPYSTDFDDFARSWWKGAGLICLRTMKSGVALDISEAEQSRVKALHPEDWLTSGTYGQVLAFKR